MKLCIYKRPDTLLSFQATSIPSQIFEKHKNINFHDNSPRGIWVLLQSERQLLRRKSSKILKLIGFSGVFSQTLQGTTDVYISLDSEKSYSHRQ